MRKSEVITPPNSLLAKTGRGGINDTVLNRANDAISSTKIDVEVTIKEQLHKLKQNIDSEVLIKNPTEETLEDFVFDHLPLKVDSHMSANKNMHIISAKLLTFVEALSAVNIDAYHIIRAHINAMDLILNHNITAPNHKFSSALLTELDDACSRYNKKYATEQSENSDTLQKSN